MSAPRRLIAGATYLVTRRCTQRQMMLRPSVETNQVFLYCLAVAAERTEIELHAFVVMSNHWHAVLTDPEARLPQFLQLLHRLVASCMNASLGRTENFWSAEHASIVALESAEDVLDKIAYVITNPTAAGLVRSPEEWPGVITRRLGERHAATVPEVYFRRHGARLPERARIDCTVPPLLRHLDAETIDRRLRALVARNVRQARSKVRDSGRTFLGADGARTMSPWRTAATPEPLRRLRPTLAARDPHGREAAIARLRAFRSTYRTALSRWRSGDRSAHFPEGTYLMRVLHGACCYHTP
ncbi:transposase [Sorangium sp. So ce1000]|uniref:transposase n=1 Tax=Sorangium sp. So ce1000 TaxID=3133325 RepID=UPI003F640E73